MKAYIKKTRLEKLTGGDTSSNRLFLKYYVRIIRAPYGSIPEIFKYF
jgi:hypothetical protein